MGEKETVRVWDVAVRVFHWSLVVLFFVAYFTGDEEDVVHVYSGYGVLALVAFRVVWGIVGTRHARFTDFIYGPAATWRYARSMFTPRPIHYLGHNPLGGWMVVALLLSLAGTCWSGLEAYGGKGHGPLAQLEVRVISPALAGDDEEEARRSEQGEGKRGAEGEEYWEEIHEAFANFTILLVILHVAGIVVASVLHKENLARAMVTGNKRRE